MNKVMAVAASHPFGARPALICLAVLLLLAPASPAVAQAPQGGGVPVAGYLAAPGQSASALRPVDLLLQATQVAGAGTPDAAVAASAVPTATAPVLANTSGLLYDQDFGSLQKAEALGWKNSSDANATYAWAPYEATITVTEASALDWSLIAGTYSDFGAQVALQPVGPGYSEYGLVFRWSSNADGSNSQGYDLAVTTDGTYRLYKSLNGKWVEPALIPSTSSPYIRQGNAYNVLGVLAQGPQLSIYINGTLANTVTDNSVSSGSIGFVAGTQDKPPAAVNFYRMTVYTADRASVDWGAGAAGLPVTPAAAAGGGLVPTVAATALATPAATAAGSPVPTVSATPVVTPAVTAPGYATPAASSSGVLFQDDFSSLAASQANGWPFGSGNGVSSVWSPGAATLTVSNTDTFVARAPAGNFDNFGLETEAGPVTNQYAEYGLLFRATFGANGNVSSGYLFSVSSDGKYWLSKLIDGQWASPSPIEPAASPAIKQGMAQNDLRVLADGPQITLFINGTAVNTLTDSSLTSGQAAAYVATENNPPASVAFREWRLLTSGAATVQWLVPAVPTPAAAQPTPTAP